MSSISYLERSRALVLFSIACVGHFIVDFSIGLWPVWKTIAHYPLVEAGLVAGVSVMIGEGMQSVFSIFADRGYWRLLIAFGALIGSASLALPLADSLMGAGVLFFLTCLGSSAFHPTAVGLVSSVHGMSHGLSRPVLISIFHTCGLLGLAVSQVLFTDLYARGAFFPLLIAIAPILLAITLFLKRSSPTAQKNNSSIPEKEKPSFWVFVEFMKHKALRRVYFILLFNQIMAWSIIFLLPDFLIERRASQSFAYGGGHFIYIIGAALTCVPLGVLANRLNTPLVIFITYSISILALILTLSFQTVDPILISGALLILGGSIGAMPPLCLSVGSDLEPKRRAMVSAFLMGFVWIFSEGFGYSISSYIASCFTKNAAGSSLAILGSLLLIGLYHAYFLYSELEPQEAQKQEQTLA